MILKIYSAKFGFFNTHKAVSYSFLQLSKCTLILLLLGPKTLESALLLSFFHTPHSACQQILSRIQLLLTTSAPLSLVRPQPL